jgi:ABC-2 type transport system permease protein
MKQLLAITRKELEGYFGTPMALIFVGAFLAATLFSFFWVDTFFARGLADVRPLFHWMPVLMIFLVAALTMRQWSEEQRAGTLEVLFTLPVTKVQLALGKFLAVMALVALSLGLTLFLPITISLLGDLDWGPVFGGYLASLLLAAAYAAIGLFVSSRTDNQIVSLISTAFICGLFYLAGSAGVVSFAGESLGSILRAIGSGSRFESIQRGVIDLRDLIYYLSLTGLFLTLNVLSLDSKRWGSGATGRPHRRNLALTSVLLAANLVVTNVWVYPLQGLRLDLTQQREYSLSPTTKALLSGLQEPLLIRGYFSEKTHPLLAPLVSTIDDLLREYQVAGGGCVQLEVVDPAKEPDKEAEANQVYGIRPTPFQVAGRYETAIINSYFNILVRYGDQNIVLGFQDLIEVEPLRDGGLDVRLKNLEYDLTRAIKKVVFGFQSVDAVLAALDSPATLTLLVTPSTLPAELAAAPATIEKVAREIAGNSVKFQYAVVDPQAAGSTLSPQTLYDQYGIQPLRASLFANDTYYLYMLLQVGDQAQVIYPQGELLEGEVRTSIESALKRLSPGFLQVVGLWTPPATPTQDMFGQMQQPISTWEQATSTLSQEYEVRTVDLTQGTVPSEIDVLVVVGPQALGDKERFAIDQYLMRGGSVVIAAGHYGIQADPMTGGLGLRKLEGGMADMLATYGITVEDSLVMDPQNEPFPVPVNRNVNGITVQEIQAIAYPFFVDVRPDAMAKDSAITSGLSAVTMPWVSPVTIDEARNAGRQVTTLLTSSKQAWTATTTDIQPNFELYPDLGFAPGATRQDYTLAVAVQGRFESAFRGQPSPLGQPAPAQAGQEALPTPAFVPSTIDVSPDNTRLVVVGSAEFLDDVVLGISSTLSRDRYVNSLKLIQNAVSWSTEDLDLLGISARGTYTRVLDPLEEGQQSFWEGLNYIVALLALAAIAFLWTLRRRNEEPMALLPPQAAKEDTA